MKRIIMPFFLLLLLVGNGCQSGGSRLLHRDAPGALGPYSGSVAYGDLIFVSGRIGERGGSFEQEVMTAIDSIEEELARADASLADVVQSTVFLIDLDRYGEFNTLYGERFGPPYPARACIQVSRLPGDARVELQFIAEKP